jgi:RHS repeat-associated protein
MATAARARTLLLSLAAFCFPVLANIPSHALIAEKPHQGGARFALGLRQGPARVNALIAPGIGGCLCDEGRRSRSTGKERDAETGLDYLGARYMSAAQGRFTSPDAPFFAQRPEIPQTWNLYTYGRNNPLYFTDPTGRQELGPMCSDGDQKCLERVGEGTGKALKKVPTGVANGIAGFLDFVTCPVCEPAPPIFPAEGPEEMVGDAVGQILGGAMAAKGIGSLSTSQVRAQDLRNSTIGRLNKARLRLTKAARSIHLQLVQPPAVMGRVSILRISALDRSVLSDPVN